MIGISQGTRLLPFFPMQSHCLVEWHCVYRNKRAREEENDNNKSRDKQCCCPGKKDHFESWLFPTV